MKPSADLYDLISALSKQEKRYFRLWANRQQSLEDKSYLVLFDAVERQAQAAKGYDEAALKTALDGEKLLRHLPSVKNYLYQMVLEALESFHAGRTPEDEVYSNLRRLHILFTKNLISQADKLLKATLKLARTHGLMLQELELLRWQLRLLTTRQELKQLEEFLTEGQRRQQAILKEYQLQQKLMGVYNRLTVLERKLGTPRSPQETKLYTDIGEQFVELLPGAEAHFDTQFYYLLGQSLFNYAIGQHKIANYHRERIVALLEAHPEEIERTPLRYIGSLNNLLITQRIIKDYPAFETTLGKLRAFEPANPATAPALLPVAKFRCLTSNLLNLLIDQGRFAEGREEVAELRRVFEALTPRLAPIEVMTLQFNFFHYFFGLGEYRTALHYLTQILNRPDQSFQRNLTDYCRILLLISHLELGNIDLLEDGMIRNTHRYFSSRGKLDGIEAFFVRMLQVIIDLPDISELRKGLEWARPRLGELTAQPEAQQFFQIFDLVAWVDSKLSNTPYAEQLRLRRG